VFHGTRGPEGDVGQHERLLHGLGPSVHRGPRRGRTVPVVREPDQALAALRAPGYLGLRSGGRRLGMAMMTRDLVRILQFRNVIIIYYLPVCAPGSTYKVRTISTEHHVRPSKLRLDHFHEARIEC